MPEPYVGLPGLEANIMFHAGGGRDLRHAPLFLFACTETPFRRVALQKCVPVFNKALILKPQVKWPVKYF